MYCPNCGIPVPESALRCKCGYELQPGGEDKTLVQADVKLPPHPGWILGFTCAGFISLMITVLSAGNYADEGIVFAFGAITAVLYILLIVFNCIFLYRMWRLAQSSDLGIKKPTPGIAVGFTFIPFFSLYWMFIAYRNLALHINHLTNDCKTPVTLVTLAVAFFVASLIPYVGPVLCFAGGVMLMISLFYFYSSAKELVCAGETAV